MSIYSSYPTIGADDDDEHDGTVLAYVGSNAFPAKEHGTSTVDLANIPAWCVPGHDDEDTNDVAGYLRLSIDDTDVILTTQAVSDLHKQLGRWLKTPKRTEK